MDPLLSESELLREALITVEHLRRREEATRKETEALLSGLHVLTNAQAVDEMFRGILQAIRGVVPFTEAAILIEESDGPLRIAASTSKPFHFTVTPHSLFKRVLAGQVAAVSDLSKNEEWRHIAPQLRASFGSAALAPLQTRYHRAMLFCVREERAFFSRSHLLVLKTFSPIAAQALQRSQQLEDLQSLVERLDFVAHHDPLTGLPNRAEFRRHLAQALDDARAGGPLCALFLINVDHFKGINDTLGHAAGDEILRETGIRLGRAPGVNFVSRIAGDEFAIVIRTRNADDVAAIARAVVGCMDSPFSIQGDDIALSISAGIALGPEHGTSLDEVISRADLALYRAKHEQRGTWCLFEPTLDKRMATRHALEAALRRALDADELLLYYQPQVDLLTGNLLGYEALVRWNDPYFGLRYPADFIPLAEEAGLIGRLGEWVLMKACADAAHWEGNLQVAVNVSVAQFRDGDLDLTIKRALERSGLAPNRLEIEITESMLIADSARINASLERIRALGVRVAMDDFGSGYSSLAYLASIRFDRIKIDRSFVEKLGLEGQADTIVSTMIDLARSLQISIVAEGIETTAQLQRLKAMGCQIGQGYFWGRPAALEEAPAAKDSGPIAKND